MTPSKKEDILARIETRFINIRKTTFAYDDVYYNNDVGYVDRQFINITPADIQNKGNNWIIINNQGEQHKPLVGGPFENRLKLQIIGFVKAEEDNINLDSLMNSLQKDIMVAILKDVELDGLCSYLVPVSTKTVDKMIYPYGGFVINLDVVYVTQGFEI